MNDRIAAAKAEIAKREAQRQLETIQLLHDAVVEEDIKGLSKRIGLYSAITVPTPDCRLIGRKIIELYSVTRARRLTREAALKRGVAIPEADGSILVVVGESHSGKSRGVKYARDVLLPRSNAVRGTIPMVYASLPGGASVKTLWSTVLVEMGDPGAGGTRTTIENRIHALTSLHQTEVVAIDEAQHLTETTRTSPMLADSLKRAVQRSSFSLVLIGQKDDVAQMLRDRQVANRLYDVIELRRTEVGDAAKRADFKQFLSQLDEDMVAYGVFAELSCLSSEESIGPLFVASNGLVGVASRIIEHAIMASGLEATRLWPLDIEKAIGKYRRLVLSA